MKISIFYFSGTGNTWFISNKIKERLLNLQYEVECYSIENTKLKDSSILNSIINESEKIVFGFPTYASDLPIPMRNFINRLPNLSKSKSVATFCTQSLASGDGAIFMKDKLSAKGYSLDQATHFIMSNNFYTPFMRLFAVGDADKVNRRNEKATVKVNIFVNKIVNNERLNTGDNFIGHFLGGTQRKYYEATIKKFNDAMYVNHDRCTKCNICINNCPVNNIELIQNEVVISDKCCLCMRCYHHCPTVAINITKKSEDINKYPRFKGPVEGFKLSNLKK